MVKPWPKEIDDVPSERNLHWWLGFSMAMLVITRWYLHILSIPTMSQSYPFFLLVTISPDLFFVKRHKGQIREAKRSSRLIKGLMMNWSTWADHVWLSQNWCCGFMVKPAKWLCFIILLIVKYYLLQSHPGLYNGIVTHMSGFCSWDQLRYNGSLVISWDIIMRHIVEV